jgi:hypothetical protein
MDKKKRIEEMYADALYNDEAPNLFADRILALFSVSNSYTKEDIVKAYDDGFNDGNQRDLNPIG